MGFGVDDCFVEIYPLGDSVENIGYVSLYLGAPPGIDVLFTLWIGDVTTRPLLHKFEDGDFPPVWGYPRMCTADDFHRILYVFKFFQTTFDYAFLMFIELRCFQL